MMAARSLAYHVTVAAENGEQHTFAPGDTVPAWAQKAITNPSAWGDVAGDEVSDEDTAGADYKAQSKADLEAEVERRNAERNEDGQIEVGGNGNKADLIAALEADDAASE